jgi:hypothetical protein
MAKMKGRQEGVIKSAAFRKILANSLNTPTKEVMAILEQRGIKGAFQPRLPDEVK